MRERKGAIDDALSSSLYLSLLYIYIYIEAVCICVKRGAAAGHESVMDSFDRRSEGWVFVVVVDVYRHSRMGSTLYLSI